MGAPAATRPCSGRSVAPVWPRGGTTSMPRLSLCARRMYPLRSRLVRCSWTVARERNENRSAISSKLGPDQRSEEHTSELQSQSNLVCRLLLEKKKKKDRE